MPEAPAQGNRNAAASHPTRGLWLDIKGTPPQRSTAGNEAAVRPQRFRATTMDHHTIMAMAMAATAPMERSQAARQNPLVLSLPHPDGGFQRFALAESTAHGAGARRQAPGNQDLCRARH